MVGSVGAAAAFWLRGLVATPVQSLCVYGVSCDSIAAMFTASGDAARPPGVLAGYY